MKVREGDHLDGPAGTAVEVLAELGRRDRRDWSGTVACWFLTCPGQSPAWEHYALSVVHLRPIEGVRPANIRVPGATHELMVVALDPAREPVPCDFSTWQYLTPLNVAEQVALPDDESARRVCRRAAQAVVEGALPAEPALSGAVEPWRTVLLKTAAHERGEEHAP